MNDEIGIKMLKILFISFLLSFLHWEISSADNQVTRRPSFAIDYDNDQFLLDGKPFRYVSGSFHYFRTPRQYWRDRLQKIRAAGLNAISTYVEWSFHQPEPSKWIWEGDADLVGFVKMAQEEDLLVLLRPGPYICAERDFGGFPYWLLSKVPDIKLRTNDSRYLEFAEDYLNQVLTRVKPLLRGNGGPIIMVQVENEYGSFAACDTLYMNKLRDIIKGHVGNDAVLYTTDGSYRQALHCGNVADAYATIDFGTTSNVTQNFMLMREFEPKGPLVNSEFYPGWLAHWNETFPRIDTRNVTKKLDEMLSLGASVNFYMFYGGTNFAFTAGANIFDNYTADLTSYDYDAPLTEAGDPTPKYFAIRETISKYLPLPNVPTPKISPKGDYGRVPMRTALRLFDRDTRALFGSPKILHSVRPPTFEELELSHWLVLYEADLPTSSSPDLPSILRASPKDRALVYFDDRLSGILSRTQKVRNLRTNGASNVKLLVENQGRVNFGNVDVEDFKGIFNVTFNNVELTPWNATGFKFATISESQLEAVGTKSVAEVRTLYSGPQILVGHFDVSDEPLDTYLNTAEWGKGVAFVNGHNLGRYWGLMGPQMTLYVPGVYLKRGRNQLVLVELEYVPDNREIDFRTEPVLDQLRNSRKIGV